MQAQQPTRARILDRLKLQGPQSVRALAEGFGLSAMAVRQHLTVLERDGLVSRQASRRASGPRPLGRPEHLFGLTEAAAAHFPQRHAELACDLLDSARRLLGDAGLEQLLEMRLRHQVAAVAPRLIGPDLAGRLLQLAAIQTENGYMATCDTERGEIAQCHCSVESAARRCPELCAHEQRFFEALLGRRLERVEHRMQGDAQCRYRILDFEAEGDA
jgi:predicted ArsR family transcriptional regulator